MKASLTTKKCGTEREEPEGRIKKLQRELYSIGTITKES